MDVQAAHAVADRSGVAADAVMGTGVAAEVQQAEQLVEGATEATERGIAKTKKKKKQQQRRPRGKLKRGAGNSDSNNSRQARKRRERGGVGGDGGGVQV